MKLTEWIVYGNVGVSSKTMWSAIMNIAKPNERKGWTFDVPYDSDDFSRCYELYTECQLGQIELEKIKQVFPWWGPFIDDWEKLCVMFLNKEPMYYYIKKLVVKSFEIDKKMHCGGREDA